MNIKVETIILDFSYEICSPPPKKSQVTRWLSQKLSFAKRLKLPRRGRQLTGRHGTHFWSTGRHATLRGGERPFGTKFGNPTYLIRPPRIGLWDPFQMAELTPWRLSRGVRSKQPPASPTWMSRWKLGSKVRISGL